MTDVGLALGKLIITAADATMLLRNSSRLHHLDMAERLSEALAAVGVDRTRLRDAASRLRTEHAVLTNTVPLVMYFSSAKDARVFAEIVRQSTAGPIDIDMPPEDILIPEDAPMY